MSEYTTGEMAKLCGVSVRTVQYYDNRGLLCPSALSEGGRRLYSAQDLRRLKIICYLRELDLSIESIRQLLGEEEPQKVIDLLLQTHSASLQAQICQQQEKLDKLQKLRGELKKIPSFDLESLTDIVRIMEDKRNMRRLHRNMLIVGFGAEAIEVAALMVWILRGIWWPFALSQVLAIVTAVWMSRYYLTRTVNICPQCHGVFRPPLLKALFADHTPRTRKLVCPYCAYHGFCVETYGKGEPYAEN